MNNNNRRLILGNGEQYVKPFAKRSSGRPKTPPSSYAEARDRVKSSLHEALSLWNQAPQRTTYPDEAVFCMRLHPDITAKTYDPIAVFNAVPEIRNIGSRSYTVSTSEVSQTKRMVEKQKQNVEETTGRLVFIQSAPEGYRRLIQQLDRPVNTLSAVFREEVQWIERIDRLSKSEQIFRITDEWDESRVELVFHPSRRNSSLQSEFLFELFEYAQIDTQRASIRDYPDGPTFVSCRISRDSLNILAEVNPLRSVHPLRFEGLQDLRNAPRAPAPKAPLSQTRSNIKVGLFDGGVDVSAPLLAGHVEQDDSISISTPSVKEFVDHGTAVAGAILHGALNGIDASSHLPSPPVSVVSFRVLPTSDPSDVDLYEAIDVIEQAVPARKDIKVFNVSFGPRGPIEEDYLSRFTYVLDTLGASHKVSFCVAVGNDGMIVGEERIQAPSDLVHGVGVGAFTQNGVSLIHAPYSCHGPGRECAKIKPDVVAFGGCENVPIHLLSTETGLKLLAWGTSFATPLASRLSAQASEMFDRSSALLGRALLIHTSQHPNGIPDSLMGHGCIAENIDDVLLCDDHTMTVIFQGDVLPTKTVRLPIPLPGDIHIPGVVQIQWTIAALAPVDPLHVSEYTSCCVEDVFYPNDKRYRFTYSIGNKVKNSKTLHLFKDSEEIDDLVNQGWEQSTNPVSDSGNEYLDEEQRRMKCKWESIVKRSVSKRGENLELPFLTLQAIGRNGARERFDYVAVVTIEAKKFIGDLYTEVRRRYPALLPIRLRTEGEIRVQI